MTLPSASKEWLIVGLTGAISALLWNVRGSAPAAGARVDAAIWVMPADRTLLACAMPASVDGYHCAFASTASPAVPAPEPSRVLVPVVTTDHTMFLVPGLFDVPSVRIRAARMPQHEHFVAQCKLRLLRPAADLHVRFRPLDGWGDATETVWIGVPEECEPRKG